MHLGSLIAPDGGEICAGIECLEPDVQADHQGEDGTEDDGVAVDFEEASVGGRRHGGDAKQEGYEDEGGVDDCGWDG